MKVHAFLALLFLLMASAIQAQGPLFMRYDSITMMPPGGKIDIKIKFQNATSNRAGAFWYNTAGGAGIWNYAMDTAYLVGDSIQFIKGPYAWKIKSATGGGAVTDTKLTGISVTGTNVKTITGTNSDGSTPSGTFTDEGYSFSATLTDAATVVWDFSLYDSPDVTIAGNRTLSIINLPSQANIVVYGCITIRQDNTGSRLFYPPSNSRGLGGLNLSGGQPFPTSTTANTRDEACFKWVQSENIFYWKFNRNAN